MAGFHIGEWRSVFLAAAGGARSRLACPGPPETRGNRSDDRGGPRRAITFAPISCRTVIARRPSPRPWAAWPAGRKILLARADRGRTLLKDELEQLADVDQVAVYHNADVESLPESIVERILDGTVDWITLTSSAITERLHELLPEPARRRIGREVRLASLSPVTSATAARLGWSVAVEATEFTWDGLVDALVTRIAADRRELSRRPRRRLLPR